MELIIKPTQSLSDVERETISELAACGFGRPNDAAMKQDALDHILDADLATLAHTDTGEAAGFALFTPYLWRLSGSH